MAGWMKAVTRRLAAASGLEDLRQEVQTLRRELAETKAGVSTLGSLPHELAEIKAVLLNALSSSETGLPRELAEIKGGLSNSQQVLGDTFSYAQSLLQTIPPELAAIKGGVSNAQQGLGETFSYVQKILQILPPELAEIKSGLANSQGAIGRTGQIHPLRDNVLRLDRLAMAVLDQSEEATRVSGEQLGFANHLMKSASRISKDLLRRTDPMPDPHPDDDMSEDYSKRSGIYVPGNEVEVEPCRQSYPWRHLLVDPQCAVVLVLGQSNAGNHGDTPYSAQRAVYSLDFLRMNCYRAVDPLPGASGTGGSVWSRLGDRLIEERLFQRVLYVPLAFGGSFLTDWCPQGVMNRRVQLALSRLKKDLGSSILPFSAVIWQQGEAEANHTEMTAAAYKMHFHDLLGDLRSNGVFAPIFVARATVCEAGPHPFKNHDAIREAQTSLPDSHAGIFAGPDTDTIGTTDRYDGCHLADGGLKRCCDLWLEVLSKHRALLQKP